MMTRNRNRAYRNTNMDTLLVFFEVQCRGVKFYDFKDAELRFGSPVVLRREPENQHDIFCVAVFVPRPAARGDRMLGHIARVAARWLSPLLQCGFVRVTGYVSNSVGKN